MAPEQFQQPSFIPGKGKVKRGRSAGSPYTSVYTWIGIIVFVVTVGIILTFTALTWWIDNDIRNITADLETVDQVFPQDLYNRALSIDARIQEGERLVDDHLVPTGLFALLEAVILDRVVFTSLSYTAEPGEDATVQITAIADELDSVALQGDVLRSSGDVRNVAINGLEFVDEGVQFTMDITVREDRVVYGSNESGGGEQEDETSSEGR